MDESEEKNEEKAFGYIYLRLEIEFFLKVNFSINLTQEQRLDQANDERLKKNENLPFSKKEVRPEALMQSPPISEIIEQVEEKEEEEKHQVEFLKLL